MRITKALFNTGNFDAVRCVHPPRRDPEELEFEDEDEFLEPSLEFDEDELELLELSLELDEEELWSLSV